MEPDRDYYTQKRPEMLPFIPERRGRVLEIGCAEGNFLANLPGVEEGWGIEPSPSAAAARGRLHRVIEGTFDDAEPLLPQAHFDVVICNDVIEHMIDHDSFLARIGRYIAPGGVIVGSIPNVRFYENLFQLLLEKDWHYVPAGILDRTHLRFFTARSLRACLARHNFEILRFQGINSHVRMMRNRRGQAYYLLSRLLIAATLGYFEDIRHLQFAFQATPKA